MRRILLSAFLLITAICAYSADFPRSSDAVLDLIHAKLGNQVTRNVLSTDNINAKICNLQYQACKDDRALLRVIAGHIKTANILMQKGPSNDGNRGLLIAYSALKCVNIRLKDTQLAAGIAISILLPNINLAVDDYNSEYGRLSITNDIVNAALIIDDDESIVKTYIFMIDLSSDHPNTSDAYRIKLAEYQYYHSRYNEALFLLNEMTDKSLIDGVANFKANVAKKANKEIK